MKLEKACVPLGFVWSSPLAQCQGPLPKAPVPAVQTRLKEAGLKTEDVDAIKMHNPVSVNEAWLSRRTCVPVEERNDYRCSLIYGHPRGPTGARFIAELIEILKRRGGGIGLFTGCAAGDGRAALVLRVGD